MIQRIQSLFLLLITLFSTFYMTGNMIGFTEYPGSSLFINLNGLVRVAGGTGDEIIRQMIPLVLLILLIGLVSLVTIFLYRNRKTQMRFVLALIILIVFFIIVLSFISYKIILTYKVEIILAIRLIIPFFMLIFSILAYIRIRKDEKLIRSYERLR